MRARSPLGCLRTVDERGRELLGCADLSGQAALPSLRDAVDALRDLGSLLVTASPFGRPEATGGDRGTDGADAAVAAVLRRLYDDRAAPVDGTERTDGAVESGRLDRVDGDYVVPLDGPKRAANWMVVLGFIADAITDVIDRYQAIRGRFHTQPGTSAVAETLVGTVVRMLESLRATVGRVVGTDRTIGRTVGHENPLDFARWSGERLTPNEP